ncbi:hypothetical protein U1Q18_037588, partial [Sarracenia purpurea var. burkii]
QWKVADLISKHDGRWDEQKVNQLIPLDREFIEAIPLCSQDIEDTMVWHFSRDDRYSVKTGYHVEHASRSSKEECSDPAHMANFWRKL